MKTRAVEQSKNERLPKRSRQGGETKIDGARTRVEVIASSLRKTGFCDVHSSKNFNTGRQRILNLLGHQQALVQESVFTGSDPQDPLFRLNVNVAHPVGNGVKEKFVHQTDHRGIRFRGGSQGGGVHRENFVHRLFQQTRLNVVAVNRFPHIPFRGGNKADSTA